jgi:hypothetical protein
MDAGKETILVVEDDPMVRNYVIAQLHGYTTIAAEKCCRGARRRSSRRQFRSANRAAAFDRTRGSMRDHIGR